MKLAVAVVGRVESRSASLCEEVSTKDGDTAALGVVDMWGRRRPNLVQDAWRACAFATEFGDDLVRLGCARDVFLRVALACSAPYQDLQVYRLRIRTAYEVVRRYRRWVDGLAESVQQRDCDVE